MSNITNIFVFLFLLLLPQKHDPYYNKDRVPSSYGIEKFINENADNLIAEYEYKVDTIYDVYIYAEKNSDEFDSLQLGLFYLPDYIYISTQEKYLEYEFKNLSKYQQRNIQSYQRTVKGVLFHELSHAYFYQTILLMKDDSLQVSPEFGWIRMFPNPSSRYSSEFIEEGFCEYIVEMTGEQPINEDVFIPQSKDDFLIKEYEIDIKYGYSVYFLRNFLNEHGIKEGLKIILSNRPPSFDEILKPELYFKRLKI